MISTLQIPDLVSFFRIYQLPLQDSIESPINWCVPSLLHPPSWVWIHHSLSTWAKLHHYDQDEIAQEEISFYWIRAGPVHPSCMFDVTIRPWFDHGTVALQRM